MKTVTRPGLLFTFHFSLSNWSTANERSKIRPHPNGPIYYVAYGLNFRATGQSVRLPARARKGLLATLAACAQSYVVDAAAVDMNF